MIFVTNDSFPELVVSSPQKGLAEIKSSPFWGDMVLSPPKTNIDTENKCERLAEERISIPQPVATSKNEAEDNAHQSTGARSSDTRVIPAFQSGSSESINASSRKNCVQEGDVSNPGNTVAAEVAIESNSPVLEDRMPSHVLPDSDQCLGHAGSVGDELECVAENDVHGGGERLQLKAYEISKASPIRALAPERKGKEEAPSGSCRKKGASQEDDESYESIESCNSARQVSGRKKRVLSFEEQLIDGSKRVKMQAREARNSGSFANWISTMVKGLSRPCEDGEPSLALPSPGNEKKAPGASTREQDNARDSMGFQSHFQSIYRPSSKVLDERLPCSDNRLLGAAQYPALPRSTDERSSQNFKKQHTFPLDGEASSSKPDEAQNINQIVHFQRFDNSSGAMVSVFAKRLDALKNILPSDLTVHKATTSSSTTTCFFCGIVGHDLRYCPQVTGSEVDELLKNLPAYGGKEDSSCLCIRCFQLDHWAAACPNALSLGKVSSTLQNTNAAGSQENSPHLSGFPYPCGSLATTYAFTMPKEIFEAVKNLQLSRTDITKWMNSIFSTSLDGYYLRLRRKLGEGPGGTQYHVACICGPQEGKPAECTSKGPIYAIVDGSRCSIATQYISNQDFLEDELKAWWSATLRGDAKIPSEDELRSKVEERRRLGL